MIGKLSIIVPVYNSEKYLDKCIKSIIEQTYNNLELILVDDGSIDNSPRICDNYACIDKRVKVIHTNNNGVSTARNIGLKMATGEYLTFVDSDDCLCTKDSYKVAMEKFSLNFVDVVIYGNIVTNENGNFINNQFPGKAGVYDSGNAIRAIIWDNIKFGGGYPWNKIWRRESLKEAYYFDKDLFAYEDKVWTLQNLQNVRSVYVMKECLYQYIQREGSLSRNTEEKNSIILNGLLAYDRIVEFYEHEHQVKWKKQALLKKISIMVEQLFLAQKMNNNKMIYELKSGSSGVMVG